MEEPSQGPAVAGTGVVEEAGTAAVGYWGGKR